MSRTVVHLLDNASRRGGGIFESVVGFAGGLAALDGWRVQVGAVEDSDVAADRDRWGDVPLLLARPERLDVFARALARRVIEAAPDIVHVHGVWGPAGRAGLQAARALPDCGLIVSPHGMLDPWAMRNSRWKKQLAWRAWAGPLLRRADAVHALGAPERAACEAVLPGAPIVTIPNGVDLPGGAIGGPQDAAAPVLLFLGRIHPKKGLPALLEAWARTPPAGADWRLVIAGWDDGGHESELRAQCARLELGERVAFAGPVFGADKDALLRSASAFILPSQSEGLPMAVLEAWSYGLPVLMTPECNLAEGFAAGAALRIEAEADSIAGGLQNLMTAAPEARRAMGARGRELVETQFSWPSLARALAAIYDAISQGEAVPAEPAA